MEIRFAEACDIPRMIELLKHIGQVHHEIRPDLFKAGALKYDEGDLKELLVDPNRPVFAAVEDGVMVGYALCILQIAKDDSVLCDRKVLYLDDLCVDESYYGKGIAKMIYESVISYATEIGCDSVTLNVWTGNDRAMNFYKKCGMEQQKICMEKKLKSN